MNIESPPINAIIPIRRSGLVYIKWYQRPCCSLGRTLFSPLDCYYFCITYSPKSQKIYTLPHIPYPIAPLCLAIFLISVCFVELSSLACHCVRWLISLGLVSVFFAGWTKNIYPSDKVGLANRLVWCLFWSIRFTTRLIYYLHKLLLCA